MGGLRVLYRMGEGRVGRGGHGEKGRPDCFVDSAVVGSGVRLGCAVVGRKVGSREWMWCVGWDVYARGGSWGVGAEWGAGGPMVGGVTAGRRLMPRGGVCELVQGVRIARLGRTASGRRVSGLWRWGWRYVILGTSVVA